MLGRSVLAAGVLAAVLIGGLGVVAGSVWIEDRHPCDDPKRAWFPRAQRWVTQPVVTALSGRLQKHLRTFSEAKYLETGLSLDETIARFLDEDRDFAERRMFAFRLARERTPEARAALRKVLANAPPEHKAFMAVLIGNTRDSAAQEWLWPLLNDTDETVVMAAIRGLGLIGGEDATRGLASMLADPAHPEKLRVAAAIALGMIGSPGSQLALIDAFGQMPSDEVATEILKALGRVDFDQVAPVFTAYLAAAETPAEMRQAAVEALSKSPGGALEFLLELANADQDPKVRAAAAWALSAQATAHDLGGGLADMAAREPDENVRRRLYEAMLTQTKIPADRVWPTVLAEENTATRIAGFNTLGMLTRLNPGSPMANTFDAEVVPELQRMATGPNSLNLQMRAVFALRRAGTAASLQALARIESTASPQIATAARNGLQPTHP
jgi:hypothetical protein